MRVVIVGGTGNISTGFVPYLQDLGHEVTLFNRGNNAAPAGSRVIVGDRADAAAFESSMQTEKFDAAIDMICFNAEQAASSVRAFRDVAHFVQCSTVCTYGVRYDWMPVPEEHPLRPSSDYGRGKVAADNVFLEAYYSSGFPVTIIKPSTTYGPQMGLLRQIAWESGWIDRVRKGKPIVVCGDGTTLHQFLHVADAAPAFSHVLGRERCLGQIYNMVRHGFTTWNDYHRIAMKVLGREVELVGIPFADLAKAEIPNFGICAEIFAHHGYFDSTKLRRDVPEFAPKVTLEEGFANVLAALDAGGRIPDSDSETWEDDLIARQRKAFA